MDYTYRKLDSFGDTFFRILQRRNSDDAWQVAPGTFDHSKEDEAQRTVKELATVRNGYIVYESTR